MIVVTIAHLAKHIFLSFIVKWMKLTRDQPASVLPSAPPWVTAFRACPALFFCCDVHIWNYIRCVVFWIKGKSCWWTVAGCDFEAFPVNSSFNVDRWLQPTLFPVWPPSVVFTLLSQITANIDFHIFQYYQSTKGADAIVHILKPHGCKACGEWETAEHKCFPGNKVGLWHTLKPKTR